MGALKDTELLKATEHLPKDMERLKDTATLVKDNHHQISSATTKKLRDLPTAALVGQ